MRIIIIIDWLAVNALFWFPEEDHKQPGNQTTQAQRAGKPLKSRTSLARKSLKGQSGIAEHNYLFPDNPPGLELSAASPNSIRASNLQPPTFLRSPIESPAQPR